MAGVKGRSGRRKKRLNVGENRDPLAFLAAVMRDKEAATVLRVRAAIALLRLEPRPRVRPLGKKEQAERACSAAAHGRFKPSPGPKVVPIRRPRDDA